MCWYSFSCASWWRASSPNVKHSVCAVVYVIKVSVCDVNRQLLCSLHGLGNVKLTQGYTGTRTNLPASKNMKILPIVREFNAYARFSKA